MQGAKNVLIIAYYWPPSGGAGVQRWLKLSKELRRLGHAVHVLTVRTEDAHYPHWDDTLVQDVAPGITVHRTRAFNPIAWGKRLLGNHANQVASSDLKCKPSRRAAFAMRIRSRLFIPDPRKGWNRSAIRKGREIIAEAGIDAIITTGPPHSTHLIGMALKRASGVRWFADFRDPWTDVFYYDQLQHSARSKRRDARYEREVIEAADRLIVVHDRYREQLAAKYPECVPKKVHYLPNGYDADDFKQAAPSTDNRYLELVYSGIMAKGYEPEVVARAWAAQPYNRPARFTVVGTAPEEVLEVFRSAGMEVQCLGMQPHHVANAWQLRADVLLCLIPAIPGADLAHVPGKLFEYLAAKKPILNIGPPTGEAASIVARCGAGITCDRGDTASIQAFLNEVASGRFAMPAASSAAALQYARHEQAKLLHLWIEEKSSTDEKPGVQ